jgi:hypothetical protein
MNKKIETIYLTVAVNTTMSTSEFTQSFFDASSKAWKKNKVKYGQAMYTYKKNAFPEDSDMPPPPVQSKASQLKSQREIIKRQNLKEEAPFPVRKSPRLRELHIKETYQN